MTLDGNRLKLAIEYLKNKGEVYSQKDVAEKMGTTPPNVSSAIKGVESVLTESFLHRFNRAFNYEFNENWLLTGEGEMLKPNQSVGDISNSNVSGVNVSGREIHINPNAYDTLLKIVESNQKTTEKFQEQIDRLITIIEKRTWSNE
ncbi:helix-turn-helix transcriptional regulator [Paraprevotella xylaniphila]|uniref:helix-turn-helix transcriptional regulator n=1 Tax=Paraprevotella xylaniphila TaxID=454155 RepID=UPI00103281FB|nr:helix-turn-helix transcriptional regulator [Paraprevotella xylaniphila]